MGLVGKAAWSSQSRGEGWRPHAGVALKFPGSWHHEGITSCETPEVSCAPCWDGCSGFNLRKSCCMTLSWLLSETHGLQKGCSTRLQRGEVPFGTAAVGAQCLGGP